MNVLYVSKIPQSISNGLTYSVPAQIKSQKAFDQVFWWNLTDACFEHWMDTGVYHNLKDFSELSISKLPKPFDAPDLVVFEGFYHFEFIKLGKECRKRKISYIVVPRSCFTWQGQKQKRLKKLIANFLIFKPFAKKAVAIQYLTEKEKNDSGNKWNKNSFIIPNGMSKKELTVRKLGDSISGAYIGRFAIYQKGLDLLLEACKSLANEFRQNKIIINFYGVENAEKELFKKQVDDLGLSDILVVKKEIFGEEKVNVLKEADFFIMTSRFEGLPMSLIEAMSYSLPCFVTDGTYMADEVEEYNAGWACETNVESIKNSLLIMMSDKDKFIEKGENAHKLSLNYSWDEIAKKSHEIYERLITKGI